MLKLRLAQKLRLSYHASLIFFLGWFVLFYYPQFSWQMKDVWFRPTGKLLLFIILIASLFIMASISVKIRNLVPQYFFSRLILFCAIIFLVINWNTYPTIQEFMGERRLKLKKSSFLMESILATHGSYSYERERFYDFAATYTKNKTLYVGKDGLFNSKQYKLYFLPKNVIINPIDTLLNEEHLKIILARKHVRFISEKQEVVFIMDENWSSAISVFILKGHAGGYYVLTEKLMHEINL